jgi:hypothetical protein
MTCSPGSRVVKLSNLGDEMPGPLEFLLNTGPNAEKQVVEAPAFSLTKVLGAGAIIITPIATILVEAIQKQDDFKAQHYVALAIGLLGFLAITAAADVLARAVGTAAKNRAEAAQKGLDAARSQAAASAARLVPFDTPVAAHRVLPGADEPVKVLAAASADDAYLLVQDEDDKIAWVLAKEVKVGG